MENRAPTEYKNIGGTPQNSPVSSSDLISSDTLPSFWEGGRDVGCDLMFILAGGSFLLTQEGHE